MTTRAMRRRTFAVILFVVLGAMCVGSVWGQADPPSAGGASGASGGKSLLDFISAGGIVGYVIILLSVVGVALVVDAFMNVREEKLVPPSLVEGSFRIAGQGKLQELLTLCQANESMIGRVVRTGLAQGNLGGVAVREAMQEQGVKEVTRLQQRVGYIGFIATIAPMLGLLGTVTGMIDSFGVLGRAQTSARPDELAVGISEALVTTCMGLIVAVPLMFFHNYFRDRVTRIGLEASGVCERIIRALNVAMAKIVKASAEKSGAEHADGEQG
jgi:biopolymer transport protein ExbB